MTSKRLVLVLAAAVVASACGGVARPESRAIQSESTTVGASTASMVSEGAASTVASLTPTTVPDPAPIAEDAESSPTTPSATVTTAGPSSTTTNPAESLDLAEVQDALDALDALFEGLDGHIGSVDLDEGETP